MGIKNRLVICTENLKILTHIISILFILKHKIYYTDKRSLTSINKFSDNITDKGDVKLRRLIMYRECTII